MTRASVGALQGSQLHYFDHRVMRFFAEAVLRREYRQAERSTAGLRAFGFDPVSRAILRPSDPLTPLALRDFPGPAAELRPVLAWSFRQIRTKPELHPLFEIPSLGPCGMVVHARDTTTVVVQRRPRRVWKLVRDASKAELLEREREAARLAPALAPAVIEWHAPGDDRPGYVALEYALDTEPVTAADLPGTLQRLTPVLMEAYRAAGVERASAEDSVADLLRAEAALARLTPSPFVTAAAAVLREVRTLVTRHAAGSAVYNTFAHGDIQASNLRRSRGRTVLIDWSNGGTHNVLFDAFIVELFSPAAAVWRDVLVNGTVSDPAQGFTGWLPAYVNGLEKTAGIALRGREIAAGLLCSMADKTTAIVARHAGTDEERGLRSLGRVQRLLAAAAQT